MRTTLLLAATLLLSGCLSSQPVDRDDGVFGHAVQSNTLAQTDQTPASTQAPEGAGSQGAAAQRRYNSGETKPLITDNTSSVRSPSAD